MNIYSLQRRILLRQNARGNIKNKLRNDKTISRHNEDVRVCFLHFCQDFGRFLAAFFDSEGERGVNRNMMLLGQRLHSAFFQLASAPCRAIRLR